MSVRTINFTFRVAGVLTDASSAVLTDPTGSWGIKRADGGGVVVGPGAVMTHAGTGTYTYSFTEPIQGLAYIYAVAVTYAGGTYYFVKPLAVDAGGVNGEDLNDGDLRSLYQCSLGDSNFQLEDYSYSATPRIREGIGRIGTELKVEGKGWVEAGDMSDFATVIRSTQEAFSIDGQNFQVAGIGGNVEVLIAAAQCLEGGPNCGFEVLAQGDGAIGVKNFKFTVRAFVSSLDPLKAYKVRTTTRPDGLRSVTVTGDIIGVGAAGVYANVILPLFAASYPVGQWIPLTEMEVNAIGDMANYSLRFTELLNALPVSDSSRAVDGERTTHVHRDEQERLDTTYEYDLLLVGDYTDMLKLLRPANVTILVETSEVTAFKELRLKCSFRTLASASNNNLLNWEHVWEADNEGAPLKGYTYPGAKAIIVLDAAPIYHYVQRGKAVGVGQYVKEPAQFFPPNLSELPRVVLEPSNTVEKVTTWEYHYISTSTLTLTAAMRQQLERPDDPQFYT